jgi:hypothetical protein
VDRGFGSFAHRCIFNHSLKRVEHHRWRSIFDQEIFFSEVITLQYTLDFRVVMANKLTLQSKLGELN